ncbi:MAG: carbonate dehydratase [Flavobacteriales bacterium]
MKSYEKLLLENKAWAQEMVESDPTFFNKLENIQTPEFLWIGCSDSRVPANQITGTAPGEVFVHRNVANLCVHSDTNMLSVLEYAVHHLRVKHVIVCGHYGCGGVKAATTQTDFNIINTWLKYIKDVYRTHNAELNAISDEVERVNRLVELNVIEQVNNLARTSIIQKAWKSYGAPHIHGWVYSLHDGLLKPLSHVLPGSPMDPIDRYDF